MARIGGLLQQKCCFCGFEARDGALGEPSGPGPRARRAEQHAAPAGKNSIWRLVQQRLCTKVVGPREGPTTGCARGAR
eukprot:5140037-Karenia_brevis.AAC.1